MANCINIEKLSLETHTIIYNEDKPLISNNNILLENKQTQEVMWVPLTEDVKSVLGIFVPDVEESIQHIEEGDIEKKIWTKELTIFLINTVENTQNEFENGLKKNVWAKIAQQCSSAFHKEINAKQVETKWKALKRTYKSILLHNNTSGKNRRYWEYYDLIHKFMYKKPEIVPEATCSSSAGLKKKSCETEESEDTSENSFQSSFQRKRKQRESEVNKRHQGKMRRLDRFNDLFEEMIKAIQPNKN